MESHKWLVGHLISLITYCETHGLAQAEAALIEAAERIAPQMATEPVREPVADTNVVALVADRGTRPRRVASGR